MTNPILEAALAYAARGWPVFPCNPRVDPPDTPSKKRKSKAPLVAGPDKDGNDKPIPHTGGLWRASTDPDQIRAWWAQYPKALIGMPTGARSGVIVIDLDPKDVPLDAVLRTLHDAVGPLPRGPRVETQSGGLHIYFKVPDEGEIPKNSAKRLERIDWRGDGGYVIVPPSTMADGKSYRWLVSPDDLAFPEAPLEVLDLVYQRGAFARVAAKGVGQGDTLVANRPPRISDDPAETAIRKYAHGALERVRADVARAPKGRRGTELNAAAFAMGPFVELGLMTEREVTAALQDGADACGLTATDGAHERDAKIERGLAAGRVKGEIEGLRRKVDEIRDEAARRQPRRPEAPLGDVDDGPGDLRPAAPFQDGGGGRRGGDGDGPGGGDGGGGAPDPSIAEACSEEPQNDTGNGRRLMRWFGHNLLNVRDVGDGHWWAGTHWEMKGGKEAFQRFAQVTAERIGLEAGFIRPLARDAAKIEAAKPLLDRPLDELEEAEKAMLAEGSKAEDRLFKRRGDRHKFAISCGNTNRINGMIAQALPHMTVAPEDMDRDPFAVNVLNGTLRVVKVRAEDPDCPDPDVVRWVERWQVRLDPHDRADRITRVMPVAWDPEAACPRWDGFMERFQPNEPIRRFLQAWHGYALTGMMGEQAFVYNYGLGANGKSTFMEAIARIQGDYAQSLPAEALTGDQQRRGDQATPEFARLPGARLVRCAELPRGQGFRESTIKMLTGGEPILVRHLHKGFFEFRPNFKAIGSGNDRPPIGGVDEGIWRRMKLVPWSVTIPPDERRPMEKVLAEFMAEASGILNWLLAGLLDYLDHGMIVPAEIQAATEEYRTDMDPVGEFTRACVVEDPDKTVNARDMFLAYTAWCHANSVKAFQEKTFAGIMAQKAFRKSTGRIRMYHDVRLHNVPDDPDLQSSQGSRGPWPDQP
jgi:putative DNA primase/helicase